MKLAWIFCLLLAGKLSTASPGDERAAAESNVEDSGYMMAFPMNDEDHLAEESAQEAVKILAESLASDDDDDDEESDDSTTATTEVKKEEDEKKEDEQPEPMGILQAELDAEDANEEKQSSLPERPFFKRPKIEELRKILGFPPPEGPIKAKPIPQEKSKAFQGVFGKTKPKITTEPSPLGGLQFNLRREDRMRPFGFPMLPLKRDDSSSFMRPFGLPDLVQAASSILRRAIVDDNNENDISKEDREEDEQQQINENEPNEDNEEDEEDDSVMIVPLPDPKEVTIERPPLFRRFPIPLPFPRPVAPQTTRPRLPFPPLTPVAFFLPIAQQIMQNIRQSQPPRSPPMMPMMHHPIQPQLQNLVPLQTQIPVVHIQPPMQQQQQQFIPLHHPMIHQQQQIVPFFPMPQAAIHLPVLMPLPPNMQQQRPVLRQMPRRMMPVHPPQQRRMPFPMPQSHAMQPQMVGHHPAMMRRPVQQQQGSRPMPRVVRPPMPPVHPVLFMMPMMPPMQHAPQQPVFHGRPLPPFVPQAAMSQPRHFFQGPEEERVIFIRPDQEEQDDDQEVLILVPSDEVEVPHRPPVLPHQFRQTPVVNPLQRIKILRDLLLARQANRQPAMTPDARAASRVVEIVQQQLRIFPAHHPQRPESSELHPVYVPYPGPQ